MSDGILSDEMKADFLQMLGGDSESREVVYHFHETNPAIRALLKGERGIPYYAEIIEIATKADAPLEEVRARFLPLLDQDRLEEYIQTTMTEMIKSGAFSRALQKLAEQKKTEVEELRRRHKEAWAVIEEEKRKRKSWFQRLFS